MPNKYYIIPIDANGLAYLGRKSMTNPYTRAPYGWGRGAPNIFGGNDQGTVEDTLYQETREESQFKVDLNQLDLGAMVQLHQADDGHGNLMTFYAIRGRFAYQQNPYFPPILARMPKYQECTGEVLTVNLGTMDPESAAAANNHVLAAYTAAFGAPGAGVRMDDFYNSEAMEALRYAAHMVRWAQI
jgi:hypothetical protein